MRPPGARRIARRRYGRCSSLGGLISIWVIALLFCAGGDSFGQDTEDKIPFTISISKKKGPSKSAKAPARTWQTVESRYTLVKYTSFKALKEFERSIDYSSNMSAFGFLSSSKDPAASVREKMDALYSRVAEILDMRRGMKKVNIEVYPGKKELHAAYSRIVGGVCRIRAWYFFEKNTIYINADDVHEGMLAHEMAHAIIDHYFSVRPPRASAEILARYVDAHLFK